MIPKMYRKGDYTLYLFENIDKPFVLYNTQVGGTGYYDKYLDELNRRAAVAVGIKIMLSDKDDGAVDIQDPYGHVTNIKYSHDWPPVVVEAVKILTDYIMRRDLLEEHT